MSNTEHSDPDKSLESLRGMQPLASRLQASLGYRSLRLTQDQEPDNRLIPLVELPEEDAEIYFDPTKSGLVCDAPLGLKR